MPTLEIMTGKGAGTKVDVNPSSGEVTLGNRRQATVILKDPWISFTHAVITKAGDGTYLVADKRSRAGTTINGVKVGESGRPLKSGDIIGLGKTDIRFTDAAARPAPASAAAAVADALTPPAPEPVADTGPFQRAPASPFAPAPAAARSAADLQRDLDRVTAEATALRQAVAARERALGESQAKVRALEAAARPAAPAAPAGIPPAEFEKKLMAALATAKAQSQAELDEAQAESAKALERAVAAESEVVRLKQAHEETVSKAKIKLEELGRHAQTLEARLTQGGKADTVAQERELTALREEARRLREAGKARIDALTAEKAALEAKLREAESRPVASEGPAAAAPAAGPGRIADLEQQLADAERTRTMLETRVEELTARAEAADEKVRSYIPPAPTGQPSSAEELAALEGAITDLNRDLAATREALAQRDAELEELRAGAGSAAAPAANVAGAGAPAAAAPNSPGSADDAAKLAALQAELESTKAELDQVRKDLEEINQDMLAQEEEYQERIAALERQLVGKG